ncbi:MAG: pantoate--beta-alanine ligase [Marinilabiliales bacterium]|nr:MAG: pantoate--beta-alanine ligase [Marinilabiliales bacterium]
MFVAKTIQEIRRVLAPARKEERGIGLVPTMGALHSGHLSLVNCCMSENDITVVSVFVNPTQFNDPADLKKYPRDTARDMELLSAAGCDVMFMPGVKTIYPRPDRRTFDFGNLDNIMEGKFRPGHFSGVAQVVSRLFSIIRPHRAYFGEKDIQQLAVVRRMTSMLGLPVEIRPCKTVREDHGLAMSSRNELLTPEQRENAGLIYSTLREASEMTGKEPGELKIFVTEKINSNPMLEVEYFEIVRSSDLRPVESRAGLDDDLIGCIAVRTGSVRLIDNVFFPNFDRYDDRDP